MSSWLGLLSDWFPFELLAHFRIQYLLGLLICVPPVVLSHRGKNLALKANRVILVELAFFVVSILLNLALIIGVFVGSTRAPLSSDYSLKRHLKIVQINILEPNTNYRDVCEYVLSREPDIVSFEEVGLEWGKELSTQLRLYPYSKVLPRGDYFGLAIFSKHPFKSEVLELSKSGIPLLFSSIDVGGKNLNFASVHTLPPIDPSYLADRNQEMLNLAELRNKNPGAFIVAGDLNCSPWSEAFWRLCHDAKLKDSEQSVGPQPSWPSFIGIPFIPIDHFLVSHDIRVDARSVGPNIGSDHYPVEMTISF
ncbi:MAG: endonuclease/exonuclease/phosphatase family protein [Candidatus Obscuribacterales bacterium]|nr:endonuclease/exonuclease/phosphatase family protein [Candidatus Obscuribacterales bacterium]